MFSLEAVFTGQNLKIAATILILFAAIYSFVREKIPADLTALLAVLGLLLTGVLTPGEAFAGFSHPATVAVAAVLILSAAIEKTGALSFLARRVLLPLGHSEMLLTAAVNADHRRAVGFRQQHCRRRRFYSNRAGCLSPRPRQSGTRADADVARGNHWRDVYTRRNFDQSRRARIRSHAGFAGFFDV
jgi:hypothetical protein